MESLGIAHYVPQWSVMPLSGSPSSCRSSACSGSTATSAGAPKRGCELYCSTTPSHRASQRPHAHELLLSPTRPDSRPCSPSRDGILSVVTPSDALEG